MAGASMVAAARNISASPSRLMVNAVLQCGKQWKDYHIITFPARSSKPVAEQGESRSSKPVLEKGKSRSNKSVPEKAELRSSKPVPEQGEQTSSK
jgi:hypothetical protein